MKQILFISGVVVMLAFLSGCSRFLHATKKTRTKNVPVGNNTSIGGNNSSPGNFDTGSTYRGSVLKDVVYNKNAVNFNGVGEALALDIYKPANATGKIFPAIVLIHGGTFKDGDKKGLASTCSKLANNGYVAISINYRLGWGFVSKASTTCDDSVNLKKAMYFSVQDAHDALDFIAANADKYNIDKNQLYIGGQSAGAITALTTAYLKDADISAFFPSDYTKKYGPLEKEGNNTPYTLKGVISMWGAFINPDLITANTALPTIFFQGEMDKAVPFNSRSFVPCVNATPVYGTLPLYNRLKFLGETAIAHVDPKGGHGVFSENFRIENILCFLNTVQNGIKKQVYLAGEQYSCGK